MAVKNTVAASQKHGASNPLTASTAGKLKTAEGITAPAEPMQSVGSDKAAVAKIDALARARAVKAAKAAQRRAASESISSIQSALAEEAANDQLSFGSIREVARVAPTSEEYVRVEIPSADLFDHTHPGVQLNRHKFEPGKTYLLRGDVALEVKRRLAMFHDEQ